MKKEIPVWCVAFFERFKVEMRIYLAREYARQLNASTVEEAAYSCLIIPSGGTSDQDVDDSEIRAELESFNIWTEKELSDEQANRNRVLWIAAGRIVDVISSE